VEQPLPPGQPYFTIGVAEPAMSGIGRDAARRADRVVQLDLALTLRMLADAGHLQLDHGDIGERLDAELQAQGRLIAREDLAASLCESTTHFASTTAAFDRFTCLVDTDFLDVQCKGYCPMSTRARSRPRLQWTEASQMRGRTTHGDRARRT